MRALAHPMRLALLDSLRREGPLTATKAAELLNDTPGNMSWHLQTLAKYGFVEEAGGGRGRSRPWRAVQVMHTFETSEDDAGSLVAVDALAMMVQERNFNGQRDWLSQRQSFPAKWRKVDFMITSTEYLTPTEMKRIRDGINSLLEPYRSRFERSERPPGALPVRIVAFGHPLPPLDTGH